MNQIVKPTGIAIGFGLILVGIGLLLAGRLPSESMRPPFDLAAYANETNDSTITKAWAAARDKQTPQTYVELAKLFLDRARLLADLNAYLAAQAANNQALQLDPTYAPALIVKAAILNGLHDFPAAARAAREALSRVPNDPTSLGVLGSSLLEMGRHEEGAQTIQKMVDVRPGISSYALAAHVRFLEGDTNGAIELLSMAFQAVGRRPQDAAWVLVQLSDLYLTQWKTTEAKNALSEARRLVPGYPFPTADLARLLAREGETDQAVKLFQEAIAVIPQIEFRSGLGDLYLRLGQSDQAEQQYQLTEAIGNKNEELKVLDNRGYVLFLANHHRQPDRAVAIARREYRIRRDPFGADALAWALYAADRSREAVQYTKVALALGTRDPLLFYHAGMISKVNGQTDQARNYLKLALDLNPNFDLLQADQARSALSELSG